ncbi:MAG: (Fe-S)-binding protein [Candidatus Micrarchaeota archaeon]
MGLLDMFGGGNTIYYPGCLTKVVLPDIQDNYKKILRKLGVDFIVLRDKEFCCGSPPRSQGYDEDVKDLALKNRKAFSDHGIKKVITSCPTCYSVFNTYKEIIDWDIRLEHMVIEIEKALSKVSFPKYDGLKVTYHDPCHLGRYSGIYDAPRKILSSIGCEIIEMEYSRERSLCCGGGGGVKANYPDLTKAVSEDRMVYAEKTGADILVTTCPMCYICLKEASKGIEVYELSQLLVGAKRQELPKNSKLAKYC